jgi:hypothetical protein
MEVTTPSGYNNGAYHTFVVKYFGSTTDPTLEIYVDGILKDNVTKWLCPLLYDDFKTAKIGRSSNEATNHLNGVIDEIKIYKGNLPPNAPVIDGPPHGKFKTELTYNFTSIDPDDEDIKEYIINWGDGTANETITGPFASGLSEEASHTWAKKGDYVITAKAVDINDAEGPIGSMSITIPRTKVISTPFLNFLQNHPLFSLILKLVLQ